MRLIARKVSHERGSVLLVALVATLAMLIVGMALLAIVDTQARESTAERTRDHAFNLAESVLNSEAFVLGRHWPASSVAGQCGNVGFAGTVGANSASGTPASFLEPNINASYTDSAYSGATWQVNICDDTIGSTIWSDALLTNAPWNANVASETGPGRVWVRAQATVGGRTRALTGLVQVRTNPAFRSKYGMSAGRINADLGAAVTGLATNALNGVLSSLLGAYPLVAPDAGPPAYPVPQSGVVGLRCGLLDMADGNGSTCLLGTLGALGALPLVGTYLTNHAFEQIATPRAASKDAIEQLRSQSKASGTYTATSAGATTAAAAPACTITGETGVAATDAQNVFFIDRVGSTGDQYCALTLPDAGKRWKALIVGAGRVILRGAGTVSRTTDTFNGVVYALNLQSFPVADGGLGLYSDARSCTNTATLSTDPANCEVVRLDGGAHVNGAVNADGKSGKVTFNEPLTISVGALVDALFPCPPLLNCVLNGTLKALGVTALVDQLLTLLPLQTVVNALLGQLTPQHAAYGSAITSDVEAVNLLTVYGASGLLPGTFRDLQSAA